MGFSPTEFWRSHPKDFWLILEAKQEQKDATDRSQFAGMTANEVAEIYEETYGG